MSTKPDFWQGLWVESSKSGDAVQYQERVEGRDVAGGIVLHTVVTTWEDNIGDSGTRSISDSLVFIPGATLADLMEGGET